MIANQEMQSSKTKVKDLSNLEKEVLIMMKESMRLSNGKSKRQRKNMNLELMLLNYLLIKLRNNKIRLKAIRK